VARHPLLVEKDAHERAEHIAIRLPVAPEARLCTDKPLGGGAMRFTERRHRRGKLGQQQDGVVREQLMGGVRRSLLLTTSERAT